MQTDEELDVNKPAQLRDPLNDRLNELAITRTAAPATGLVLSYVVATRLVDSNVNQQVTAYNNLTAALDDYKSRFDKLTQAGDVVTLQLLTTLGTIVLDIFVNTEFK